MALRWVPRGPPTEEQKQRSAKRAQEKAQKRAQEVIPCFVDYLDLSKKEWPVVSAGYTLRRELLDDVANLKADLKEKLTDGTSVRNAWLSTGLYEIRIGDIYSAKGLERGFGDPGWRYLREGKHIQIVHCLYSEKVHANVHKYDRWPPERVRPKPHDYPWYRLRRSGSTQMLYIRLHELLAMARSDVQYWNAYHLTDPINNLDPTPWANRQSPGNVSLKRMVTLFQVWSFTTFYREAEVGNITWAPFLSALVKRMGDHRRAHREGQKWSTGGETELSVETLFICDIEAALRYISRQAGEWFPPTAIPFKSSYSARSHGDISPIYLLHWNVRDMVWNDEEEEVYVESNDEATGGAQQYAPNYFTKQIPFGDWYEGLFESAVGSYEYTTVQKHLREQEDYWLDGLDYEPE